MGVHTKGNRFLLQLADMYVDAGGTVPYTARDVAKWAVANGHYSKQAATVD